MVSAAVVAPPAAGKPARTHRALVEATRAELEATGGRFSGEAVAARAGMAPATFYAYFPSKDEALAAALDDVLGRLVDVTLAELQVDALLDGGVEAVARRAVTVSLEVFVTSAVVFRVALARLPESRTIRDVYRHHQAEARAAMERFLRLGAVAGKLTTDDPAVVTTALLVLFQGLNNPLLLQRGRDASPVVDQLVAAVAGVLRGDRPGP